MQGGEKQVLSTGSEMSLTTYTLSVVVATILKLQTYLT